MKKYLSLLLAFSIVCALFSGCASDTANSGSSAGDSASDAGSSANGQGQSSGKSQTGSGSDNGGSADSGSTSGGESATTAPVQSDADMFTDRDLRDSYDTGKAVTVQLNGTTAAASSDSVKISGGTVMLTAEATYIISGTLDDGMLVVNAPKTAKLQIVFDGISITSPTSAALYILEADKVVVTLADCTQNTLQNGGKFEAIDDNNIDGAVFSKQDMTFNGGGSLTVSSPAGHGIVCKDDLVITCGSYAVNSASHGLDANDSVRITGETNLTIDAGKDGIHCENSDDTALGFVYVSGGNVNVEAEGDGIMSGAYMQIEGGVFDIVTGGGSVNGTKANSGNYGGFMGGGGFGGRPGGMQGGSSSSSATESSVSMKGLKASGNITVNGGTIKIDSADDSIHSNASVNINGGDFDILSGDDGVHADENLIVTDCTVNIGKSYEGLEAHKIYVQGGKIVLNSTDDGLNASGGTDASGTTGGRDGMFGGGWGGGGGFGHGGSSDGVIDISGGELTVYASGDGMDANGTLTISGGFVYVANPTASDTSVLDSDVSPVIYGGTFISTGSTTMMAQSFGSNSTQGVIACTTGNQSAGGSVSVKDSNGNTLIAYDIEYSCVLVIISSPDLVKGATYTLTVGSASGSITAN